MDGLARVLPAYQPHFRGAVPVALQQDRPSLDGARDRFRVLE